MKKRTHATRGDIANRIALLLHLKEPARQPKPVSPSCGSGEMANTLALGASAERLAGSSPAFRTSYIPEDLEADRKAGWPLWF